RAGSKRIRSAGGRSAVRTNSKVEVGGLRDSRNTIAGEIKGRSIGGKSAGEDQWVTTCGGGLKACQNQGPVRTAGYRCRSGVCTRTTDYSVFSPAARSPACRSLQSIICSDRPRLRSLCANGCKNQIIGVG